jgi:Ca-activated chloride channel homolog
MNTPELQIIPLRPVICSENPSILDVLIRILPTPAAIARPPLNIGFAIDISASMTGQKLTLLHQALTYALQHLQRTDRISITTFSDRARILFPSNWVLDKSYIQEVINPLQAEGSTALYPGWVESAMQVSRYFQVLGTNRVVLFSDGLANIGETNPDTFAMMVHGLAQRGVSTIPVGIGENCNEDLLKAIAHCQGVQYHSIQDSTNFPQLFENLLTELLHPVTTDIGLNIEPQAGVEILDVFSEIEHDRSGYYRFPDLLAGNSVELGLRLKILPRNHIADLCCVHMEWRAPTMNSPPQNNSLARQQQTQTLRLSAVPFEQLAQYTTNLSVQHWVKRYMKKRARQERNSHSLLKSTHVEVYAS